MRRAIMTLALFGVTATLAAQTPSTPIQFSESFKSESQNRVNGITTMLKVEMIFNGIKVTADEAVFNPQTGVMDLTGHVQLTMPAGK